MKHQRGYTFKLKPTQEQECAFCCFAGASRWVWNTALDMRRAHYALYGKSLSSVTIMRTLTEMKCFEETSWLSTIHSQVLQQPVRDLDNAYKRFFKGLGSYPVFKKRGRNDHFRYPQGVKLEGKRIYFPSIGWVRFFKSRGVRGTVKSVTIKRKASGWYAILKVEWEAPEPEHMSPDKETSVGIDMGLRRFATFSNGTVIETPRFFRDSEKKLRKASKSLSRKKSGSSNWLKAKHKLGRAQEDVARSRKDFLDKLSTELVDRYDLICIEDLNVAAMKRSLKLGKSVSDSSWGAFVHMLEYKAEERGKTIWKANSWWPSSKTCSSCGHVNGDLNLSDTAFVCPFCELVLDRDLNAARNLVAAGLAETQSACGEDIRPSPLRGERANLREAGTCERELAPAV